MLYLNDSLEYNRMIETAKKRASQLRDDAVTDFWHGAGESARRALRSATRFAASLARHSRMRRGLEG